MDLPQIFYWILTIADSIKTGSVAVWQWLTTDLVLSGIDFGIPIAWIGGTAFLVIIAVIIVKALVL